MMTKQAELKKQAYESDLKSRALSVLIYLIDRSNQDLTCFPAIPTMAAQLHISVSTVKRALHELVQAGFIKKDSRFRDKNRGQTSNLYTLILRETMPEAIESKKTAAPVSATAEHKKAEQKCRKKTACSMEHITFENLKAEKQQEDGRVDYSGCVVEDTVMKDAEPRAKCEPVRQKHSMKQISIHSLNIINLPQLTDKGKDCKLVMLSLQQQTLFDLFQWTGAGVNLHPP